MTTRRSLNFEIFTIETPARKQNWQETWRLVKEASQRRREGVERWRGICTESHSWEPKAPCLKYLSICASLRHLFETTKRWNQVSRHSVSVLVPTLSDIKWPTQCNHDTAKRQTCVKLVSCHCTESWQVCHCQQARTRNKETQLHFCGGIVSSASDTHLFPLSSNVCSLIPDRGKTFTKDGLS